MTAFWIIAGLLLAGALMFLLPPLLLRTPSDSAPSVARASLVVHRHRLAELEADLRSGAIGHEQYEQARREIEQQALDDAAAGTESAFLGGTATGSRSMALAVGVAVPVLALSLYAGLGNLQGLVPQPVSPPAPEGKHALTPDQIAGMTERLASRLKDSPEDAEGWAMLARSYGVLRRYEDAVRAYEQAVRRAADNAQLLADYADVLALTRGRRLAGEPFAIIQRALLVDARNVKALALAGTAEFEARNFASAIGYWERIVSIVPPDSEAARSIQSSIRQARERLAGATIEQPTSHLAAPAAATGAGSGPGPINGGVSGTVTLAPGLASRVAPGDTVFVFARAASGPRMPLAIQKVTAADLPLRFRLDDTMAMSPAMTISRAGSVVVGARVSRSGSATPKSGDLEGSTAPVAVGAADVTVVIERIVP